jgi:hypothetical protein
MKKIFTSILIVTAIGLFAVTTDSAQAAVNNNSISSDSCSVTNNSYSVPFSTSDNFKFNVLDNDSVGVDFINYSISNSSSLGQLTSLGNGEFSFEPNQVGEYSFTYSARCPSGTTKSALVNIVVPVTSEVGECLIDYSVISQSSIVEGEPFTLAWSISNTFSNNFRATMSSIDDTRSDFNFTTVQPNGYIIATTPISPSSANVNYTYNAVVECYENVFTPNSQVSTSQQSAYGADSVTIAVQNSISVNNNNSSSSGGGGSAANPVTSGSVSGSTLSFIAKLQIFIKLGFGYDIEITGRLDMPTIDAIRAIRASRGL